MPTAYIYRGTFAVHAGETLRYREIAPDGVISPEVTKSHAELAGIGSLSVPAVSLTPTVAAPSLSGVQIGAIAGAFVSLRPTVSPAAVSGVQVGSIGAAAVTEQPVVAAPSLTGVQVGSIGAASVSLQPTVAVGGLTGVAVQAGSINAAAVSLQPTVAVGSLTGVQLGGPVTLAFESSALTDSTGATWEKVTPSAVANGGVGVITSGVASVSGADGNCLSVKQSVYEDGNDFYAFDTFIRRTMDVAAGDLTLRVRRANSASAGWGYVKVGGTLYDLGFTTINAFVNKTLTIPAAQTNVVVEIGFTGGTAFLEGYIDSVSIPQ